MYYFLKGLVMVFFKAWKIFHALVIITFLIHNLVFTKQSNAQNLETIVPYNKINNPLKSDLGMVSSQQWLASEVGAKILEEGGNAVDAAVATGFALAVVLPRAVAHGGVAVPHDGVRGGGGCGGRRGQAGGAQPGRAAASSEAGWLRSGGDFQRLRPILRQPIRQCVIQLPWCRS